MYRYEQYVFGPAVGRYKYTMFVCLQKMSRYERYLFGPRLGDTSRLVLFVYRKMYRYERYLFGPAFGRYKYTGRNSETDWYAQQLASPNNVIIMPYSRFRQAVLFHR
jgi:hypothetical protein